MGMLFVISLIFCSFTNSLSLLKSKKIATKDDEIPIEDDAATQSGTLENFPHHVVAAADCIKHNMVLCFNEKDTYCMAGACPADEDTKNGTEFQFHEHHHLLTANCEKQNMAICFSAVHENHYCAAVCPPEDVDTHDDDDDHHDDYILYSLKKLLNNSYVIKTKWILFI